MNPRCPYCGQPTHIELSTVLMASYDHRMCRANHHVAWVEAPATLDRAEAYRIPFGMYLGQSFAEIDDDTTGRGRRWLEWVATSANHRTIRQLAQAWLEAHPLEVPR